MASEKSYDTAQRFDRHISTHLHSVTNPATLGLTSSMQTVVSDTLGLGVWRISGQIVLNPQGTGGAFSIRAHASGGLVMGNGRLVAYELYAVNGLGLADYAPIETTLTANDTVGTGGATRLMVFNVSGTVTVAGTLSIQMSQASANTNALQGGSFMDSWQIT